jgi:hypothetical protein
LLGLNQDQVAGLGAGVIGGIVAGAAAFVVVGAVSGKKGYDAYLRHKNNMNGAATNPLYKDNGLTGTNPFYAETKT